MLLAVAAVAAVLVKDALDVRNPDYAVAKLTVTADSVELPVLVAGYQWQFLFDQQTAKKPQPVIELSIPPASLMGGEQLELNFSQTALSYTVRQSRNYSYEFFESEEQLTVPFEPGGYIYEVRAEYERGWVLYYFYIVVG